ncbi:hypothetical protein AVEN_114026-1, partial [Araneus ventricosus]
ERQREKERELPRSVVSNHTLVMAVRPGPADTGHPVQERPEKDEALIHTGAHPIYAPQSRLLCA